MDGLKQRIIGALVLVSLAVIFVPMLFDEPHSERTSSTIKIPEEPPFPEVDAPEPVISDAPAYRLEEPEQPAGSTSQAAPESLETADAPVVRAEPEPEARQPVASAPQEQAESGTQSESQPQSQPEPTSEPAPSETASESAEYTGSLEGAWVVQLGSFGSAGNARNLRNKVRDTGYSSHLQQIQRGDATLTRVFSGPFAEKAEAERAKKTLDREFGLNSLVTSGGK